MTITAHIDRFEEMPAFGSWPANPDGLPPERVILNHWQLGTDQETHDIQAPFPVRKGNGGYPINLETMRARTKTYAGRIVGLEMEITPAYYLLDDELSDGQFDPRRLEGVRHVARAIRLLDEMHGIDVDLLYGFNWWRGVNDQRRLISDAAVSNIIRHACGRIPSWGFPLYGDANPANGWRWYSRVAAGINRAEELHDATGQTITLFVTPIGYTTEQFVLQCQAAATMVQEIPFVDGVAVWAVGPRPTNDRFASYTSIATAMRSGLAELGPLPAMAEAVLDEGGEG